MTYLIIGAVVVLVAVGLAALALTADTQYPPDPTYDPSAVKGRPDDY